MTGGPSVQFKPAYHQSGEAVGFDYPDEADEAEQMAEVASQARQETAIRIFQMLTSGGKSPAEIGRLALLIDHQLRREKTHAQLADRIGVSRVRVTQMLTHLDAKSLGF